MIYLNGQFMPLEEARIPVLDRGFIFGDGVYEVIPAYQRKPFRLREHLARLQASLDAIKLKNPHRADEWRELIAQVIARNGAENQSIYLQVTRGAAPRDHAFPAPVTPTVFIMSTPLANPPREQIERGVAALSMVDNRWLRCNVKATSLLANVLLRQSAVEQGAAECVLLRDGYLTEGAASNIFIVLNGELRAVPKSNLILSGITYDVVLELAAAHGIAHRVAPVSEAEVRTAQEIMLTSTTKEILAITTLDGKAVGAGRPGPVFERMWALFQRCKQEFTRAPESQLA